METITYYCPIHIDTFLYKELKAEKATDHVVKFFSDTFGELVHRLRHPKEVLGEVIIKMVAQEATPLIYLLDDGPFECTKCKKYYMKEECIAVKEC